MGRKARSPCSCFSWCDKDTIMEIAEYLDVKSTMMLAATCKSFNPVMSEDCIWKYTCLHTLQIPDPGHAAFKWFNAFDDAPLLEDLASPSRMPKEETVEDTLKARSCCVVKDIKPWISMADWAQIGAFLFESDDAQLLEDLASPSRMPKEETVEDTLKARSCCVVKDIKPGISMAGLLQTSDEFFDGSCDYDLLGYQYCDKTWRAIEDAINQIHNKNASEPSFEAIYRKMGFAFNSTNDAIAVLQMAALITTTGPQCEKSGSIPELPTDVLSTLLARLPVLKFRTVSKEWETILRSREFLKQQIEHSRYEILVVKWHLHENDIRENGLSFYDPANGFAEWAPQLRFLWEDGDEIDMGGSCRGLICLLGHSRALICNPATRQIRVLDDPYIVETGTMDDRHGLETYLLANAFGYDSATDAYKIYRLHNVVSGRTGDSVHALLEFYSTASNLWDVIQLGLEEFDGISPSRSPGVFFMGSCHFKAFQPPYCVPGSVMCVNCSTNHIRRFPLPPGLTVDQNHTLSTITNRLALVTYPLVPPSGPMEIWVLDGYAVEEIWSPLLHLDVGVHNWFDRALFFIMDELILVERYDNLQPAVVELQNSELRETFQLMVGMEFCWDAAVFRECIIDLDDVIPPPNQVAGGEGS